MHIPNAELLAVASRLAVQRGGGCSSPAWRRYWLLVVAVLAPLLACLALVPFRDRFANTSAALVLGLIVVAVATAGDRLSGVLAACSSGLWFDFFLTQPYQRFAVTSGADVETLLLLLAVGVAVTEITHRGRRQQAKATQRARYLEASH
jgi:K+-sensing histidine kinase KdpD